jgi:hypothetical protein
MRPTPWNRIALVAALASCGGSTVQSASGGDGGTDAQADAGPPGTDAGPPGTDAGPPGDDSGGLDAPADVPLDSPAYLACMDPSGQVDGSLKACKTDSDCVIKQEQTDCCGTVLYVGIASPSASQFDACQTSWLAHFPACGCATGQSKTEDGTVTYPWTMDAGMPQVHCTDFTMSGGVCLTYTP